MGKKCGNTAYRILLAVMTLLCIFIGAGAVIYAQDRVFTQVLSSSLRLFFPLLLAVAICVFLVLLYRVLDRLGQRQLIAVSVIMLCVMLGIFLIIFMNFRVVPTTDALNVQDTALFLAKTGKVPITLHSPHGEYFARYANNYFLVVILRCYFKLCLILGIQDMYWPLILLSFAALMTSVVFMYLTGVLLGGVRRGAKILALCVLNPLYYLLVLWVYTNVLSIPFTIAGIYFSLRVYRAKSAHSRGVFCVLTAIVAVFGYYIRATSMIPIVAVAICAFLWGLRGKKRRMLRVLKCAVLCAVVSLVLFHAVAKVNDWHFSEVSDGRFPITHWIMMASHGNGKHNIKDVNYTMQFETVQEKSAAALRKTIENYKSMTATGLASFMYEKLLTTWSFGDGGDLLSKVSQDNKMTELYSWLIGSQSDLFREYCYAFRIATIFLILVAIWNLSGKKEIDSAQFVFLLSLFGGILFYCFWEVKATYSLPFVYIMLLIAAQGADALVQSVPDMQDRLRGKGCYAALTSFMCAMGICVWFYNGIVNSNVTLQDWTLNGKMETSIGTIFPDGKELELAQEIYASKPFNHITLAGKVDKAAIKAGDSAQLTICDASGQTVFERTIEAKELEGKGYLTIETGKITPRGRERFVINITKSDDCQGEMYFRCRTNKYLDIYDGVLTVNGERHRSDLFLQVYNEYEGPWCSVKIARVLFVAMVFAILLLYFWMYMDIKKSGAAKKQSA